MKKIVLLFFVLGFILAGVNDAKSQEIGLRLGSFGDAGAAIDGTLPMGANRIHADLGFGQNYVAFGAFYDWKLPIADGFSFYPGLGGEVLMGDFFVLALGGELGFEYAFSFPLTIGLDWRPMFGVVNSSSNFNVDHAGFNIRYRF